MGRLIFILILAAAVYLLLRSYRGSAPEQAAEDMVRCAHCGVHVPKGESIGQGLQFFCCKEHAQLGKR